MKISQYTDYILEQTKAILSIDSPSSYTQKAVAYVSDLYRAMGYQTIQTIKGGLLVDLGGEDENNAIVLEAHIDTLGAMVAEISDTGRLRLDRIGGLNPNNIEGENCHVITRSGKQYEGTFQLKNASIHVNGEYNDIKRTFDTMELVLDENVKNQQDVLSLGIFPGDIVAFDPRTRITESGYIKSRFLDDKLSVSILLGFAKYLKEENIVPKRKIYHYITVFEEVGHGGSSSIPTCAKEVIAVDMGCVGKGLGCTEHHVSICAKDSRGPYTYEVVGALIETAKKFSLNFAVDVYPHYSSDVDTTLTSGYDIRHGLIGPGVYASHGYERSHRDGIENTFLLLIRYLC